MSERIAIVLSFVVSAAALAWFTLLPAIGTLWLFGWLK